MASFFDSPLFDQLLSAFCYSSLSIVVLGLFGNVVMFLIFSKRGLKKLSISLYFRVMGLINIYVTLNWIKIFFILQYNLVLIQQSDFLCKTVTYSIYVCGPISAWLLVVAGLDRFFTILYSSRFHFIQKPFFPPLVVIFVVIFNIVYYFEMLIARSLEIGFDNSTNSSQARCTTHIFEVETYMDLFNSAVVPFGIMLASSVATFYGVIRSRMRIRKTDSVSRSHLRDLKFGATMVILNVFFFATNAPNPLLNTITTYVEPQMHPKLYDAIAYFFIFLYYSFYTLIFYAQLAVNSLVRRAFFRLFMGRGARRRTHGGASTMDSFSYSLNRTTN